MSVHVHIQYIAILTKLKLLNCSYAEMLLRSVDKPESYIRQKKKIRKFSDMLQ